MKKARSYAGIGSRSTPEDVCELFEGVAERLAREGWLLRSGSAKGADTAFERGVNRHASSAGIEASDLKEIYVPWDGFDSPMGTRHIGSDGVVGVGKGAREVARRYHPAWERASKGAKKLLARNSGQILGKDLNLPSQFVISWTKDGAATEEEISRETGGTGQALRVALAHNIPVFNAKRPEHRRRLESMIEKSASRKRSASRGGASKRKKRESGGLGM